MLVVNKADMARPQPARAPSCAAFSGSPAAPGSALRTARGRLGRCSRQRRPARGHRASHRGHRRARRRTGGGRRALRAPGARSGRVGTARAHTPRGRRGRRTRRGSPRPGPGSRPGFGAAPAHSEGTSRHIPSSLCFARRPNGASVGHAPYGILCGRQPDAGAPGPTQNSWTRSTSTRRPQAKPSMGMRSSCPW